MKKSILAALVLLPACAFSQSLIVNMKDGQTVKIPVTDIANLSFKESVAAEGVQMSVFTDPVLREAVAKAAGVEADAEELTAAQVEALTELSLYGTKVASLEGIETLTALKDLNLGGCSNLVTVALGEILPNLEVLQVGFCDNLETVTLGSKPALKELYAMYNPKMNSIDLEECTALQTATIAGADISSVEVHLPSLEKFTCSGEVITSVDLSGCDNLKNLTIDEATQLDGFDIAPFPKLEACTITGTKMSKFTTEKNPNLVTLTLNNNASLWHLDLSKSLKLQTVSCIGCYGLEEGTVIMSEGQEIPNTTGIYSWTIQRVPREFPEDVASDLTDETFRALMLKLADTDGDGKISQAEAEAVTIINAPNAGLTSVDFTWFNNIEELDLSGNELTSIDLSQTKKISLLNLNDNKLTSLNVEPLSALRYLYANNNEIASISRFGTYGMLQIELSHNKLASVQVYFMDNLNRLDLSYNEISSADIRENAKLAYMDVSHNQIKSITMWSLKGLVDVKFNDNPFTQLDEAHNWVLLENIDCSNTDITTLNLSQNEAVQTVIATGCPNLTDIYVPNADVKVEKDANTTVTVGAPAE